MAFVNFDVIHRHVKT